MITLGIHGQPPEDIAEQFEQIPSDESDIWFAFVNEVVDQQNFLPAQIAEIERCCAIRQIDLDQVTFIFNNTVDLTQVKTQVPNLVSVNFFRMLTWWHKYRNPDQEFNTQWQPGQQALYMMGKPNKPHRAPWLCSLIHGGVQNDLVYSFVPGTDTLVETETQEVFDQMDWNVDARDFGDQYGRDLDIDHDPICRDGNVSFHYTGFPFNADYYRTTCLSLISETNVGHHDWSPDHHSYTWSTEKTWRAIANHHPFVAIAAPELIEDLRAQGYNTWDRWLSQDQLGVNQIDSDRWTTRLKYSTLNVLSFLYGDQSGVGVVAKKNSDLMDQHAQAEIDQVFQGDLSRLDNFIESARYPNLG